jgi:hypothetical protein
VPGNPSDGRDERVGRSFRSAYCGALLIASLAAAGDAPAQSVEPRPYSSAPVGVNFLLVGYGYVEGGVTRDPTLLAYSRAIDVMGRSGKVGVLLSYAKLAAKGDETELSSSEGSGLGDPKFAFTYNFYGAPALGANEFASYRQDLIVGVSLYVSAPWGHYDGNKPVNIGANRWSFRPELGMSKAWDRWIAEAAAGITFYTDNKDYLGGQTRGQDPVYYVQGHLIYNFRSGIWAALDGIYFAGGRTTIDGVPNDDLQQNSRLGATFALPLNRRNSIKFSGSAGVSSRTGSAKNAVGIAWQYRWGGGL